MTAVPVLVEASLPQVCDVCKARRRMLLLAPRVPYILAVMPCPHCCGWGPDEARRRLPIRYYPREAR